MGTNFIDFDTTGVTPALNDTNAASVSPYADGETATATVFNRPVDIIRARTEVIRELLNNQKYLNDADRAFLVTGGGNIVWDGPTDGSPVGTGIFTIDAAVSVRPFMTLGGAQLGKRATCLVDGPGTDTLAFAFSTASAATHAYGSGTGTSHIGGNEYSIKFVLGGVFGVVLGGSPANDITVTLVSGTTTTALATAMNAHAVFTGLGLVATPTGTAGITVISDTPGANTLPASRQRLLGALDAERHVISVSDVSTFFATPANVLAKGDVVGIWYDSLFDGAGGGRLESVPDYGSGAGTDNTGLGVGQLFNLRVNPEKAPYSIPLCTVEGNNLVFLNQVSVVPGQTQNGLSAGFVQRSGDTMTGGLSVDPTYLVGSALEVTVPAEQSPGTPVDDSCTALNIATGLANGVNITTSSGDGVPLQISNAGTSQALYIANTGANSALALVNSNAAAAAVQTITTNAAAAALKLLSTHATGVAFIARTSNVLADPASTTAYIEGRHTDTLLELRPSGATGTVAAQALRIYTPTGSSTHGRGIYATSAGPLEVPLVIITNTGAGDGLAAQIMGRQTLEYAGVGAALTLDGQSWAGPDAYALLMVPATAALPGTPVTGAMGMEAFTNGAVNRARVRSGVGNSERSGTKTTLFASGVGAGVASFAGWNGDLYYWIDVEGVLHLRGTGLVGPAAGIVPVDAGGLTTLQLKTSGSNVILPAGARPLQPASCHVTTWTESAGPVFSDLCETFYFTVETNGELWLKTLYGLGDTVEYVSPIAIDYPLF